MHENEQYPGTSDGHHAAVARLLESLQGGEDFSVIFTWDDWRMLMQKDFDYDKVFDIELVVVKE